MKKLLLVIMLFLFTTSFTFAGKAINTELTKFTYETCQAHNVPFDIVIAIGIVESDWRNLKSYRSNSNGSYDVGIFQLNSRYTDYYERTFWYKEEDFNPWNEYHNVEMAVMYLEHLYSYTKNWEDAVKAYNTGLHGLKKYPETAMAYLAKVANALNRIQVFTEDYIYYD